MAYFAAILHMERPELNAEFRQAHLDYLADLGEKGKVFKKGPFIDGSGGMVIYIAESFEEATQLAETDPYVEKGVRKLDLREWGI
ncbi:YciI family protein [Bacillus solitudinis]|uniref:YciI family protein n=1 Tax=Bacillus solitudinis TaxID=2014074 RepID=UPI000C231320|nr:YciI family protein [Bacillus solitudinis]